MLTGPLFVREALTAPRQTKHFIWRAGYIVVLTVLMYTAGQVTAGFTELRTISDIARLGTLVFHTFAIVQLSAVIAFSLLAVSTQIAQEKDRRTLILLLMTDLRDRELVVGKLTASLLPVCMLIAVSVPAFALLLLLGGVSLSQILWIEAICLVTAFAAGCWAALVAFWREKTFQTLAVSALGVVLFLSAIELISGLLGPTRLASQIALLNPYRALSQVLHPLAADPQAMIPTVAVWETVIVLAGLGVLMIGLAIAKVRTWNPSRSVHQQTTESETVVHREPRRIWRNPIVWREICTRAYGRKILVIKAAYLVFAAGLFYQLVTSSEQAALILGVLSPEGVGFVLLTILGLLLVNAQAVTSITSERDGQTLELLLATDVSAREFVFGKLGGVFYNAKEVLLVPLALLIFFLARGALTAENFVYVVIGTAALSWFAAMLGLHAGFSYENSRSSISNSLGTVFFLFIGIFICMMLIVEARSSFALQFTPFLAFILGGSVGLWASLTHKNPSPALTLAAGILPFCTFYAITSFLLGNTLGVCLFVTAAYGFTTIAMLVPAISEFDVALGRSTADKG